jgi:hypothetical protein
MNRSKKRDRRFWTRWNSSGATQIVASYAQTYEPLVGETITTACRVLVGMASVTRGTVKMTFNDIEVVAKPGDSAESLSQFYLAECHRQHEEYIKSPEYAERQRRAEEERYWELRLRESALKAAPKDMTLRDKESWKQAVEKNPDGIGGGIIRYAERWARIMEGRIANGETLESCAKETSHIADSEGITGSMYGGAVSILARVWVHGEQLRRWHNKATQLGTEGDEANEQGGVLNPAMLSIG